MLDAKTMLDRLSVVETIDINELEELNCSSSSKGNQRKWYDRENNRYVKEQLDYQGIKWDDWKVECIPQEIISSMGTGIKVVQQYPVQLSCGTFGVCSYSFIDKEAGEGFISFQRILEKMNSTFNERLFPIDRFKFVIDVMERYCGLDCTEYLIVMTLLDYIVLNEDRHLNNFGVIKCKNSYRLAPLFDFGIGMFEGSLKYKGKTYEQALLRVDGKPFATDLYSILVALNRDKQTRDILQRVLPHSIDVQKKWIPNTLAEQHLEQVQQKLQELML